jgi:WD40 repeat protein
MRRTRWLVALLSAGALTVTALSAASGDTATNVHFTASGTVALPGLGLSLAWSPAGDQIATGGHFVDRVTHQRYDTRTVDVRTMKLSKSFDCHYWWAISQTWQRNPYIGEVIVDGGGDHAAKIWNASSAGSTRCNPGQTRAADGAVHGLFEINGWITSLQFSPDGRYLAGTSRDRTVRIWQIAPGPNQFNVVRVWYDKLAGNYLSVRWAPNGRRLAVGDRKGRVAEWSFDPAQDLWSQDQINAFAKVGWEGQPGWFSRNRAGLAPKVLWMETGHKEVWNVRYSPDGTRVAAAGGDGVLSVYSSGTGQVVYRSTAPVASAFNGLDWSPDGALIAVGASDHAIYVFNASNGSLYDKLVGHKNVVSAVAWSPNGRVLASTAGGPRLSAALNQTVHGPDDAVHLWSRR